MISVAFNKYTTTAVLVLSAIFLVVNVQGYGQQQQQRQRQRQRQRQEQGEKILTKEEIGDRDRFWKHNLNEESLIHDGINQYHNIQNCIFKDILTPEESEEVKTVNQNSKRKAGRTINNPFEDNIPMLIVIENAMHPTHVKSVQALATCIRKHMPHLYESRAMYQEMNLDEDDGSGGNCPTHLAPLVGLFLPEVVKEMEATLKFAYDATGWKVFVDEDQANVSKPREKKMYPPEEVGIRASEHLTYSDFPRLAEHHDGDTVYTMNFAFSSPEQYKGGEFFILATDPNNHDVDEFRDSVKPNKHEALVFLGGKHLHGVNEILGGHREMFSTELWAYPDTPFGSNLWSNYPANMETYVKRCNKEHERTGSDKCTIPYDKSTAFHDSRDDVRKKYGDEDYDEDEDDEENEDEFFDWDNREVDGHGDKLPPPVGPGINRPKDNKERPNRIKPNKLKPKRVIFDDGNGNEIELNDFFNVNEEPDFLIPKKLDVGEMRPILWREDLSPIDGPDGESFVIGFPPELHEEFTKYVANSGMMKIAHQILYKEKPLEQGDQRIYTLDDGEKWTAMVQGSWDTDMVWLDPGDESCFESLLGVLRRGGFDKVLDEVGKAFDLDGLMVQGVGAIFLSEYDRTENMHVDIPGSRGSFYNIIVPVHIPEDDVAIFKMSDIEDEYQGQIRLDPNVGVILGGESRHGTGECHYRPREEFRLSFAVYVADINERNIDMIASDSTSLWPTSGDQFFFRSQKGRLWSKDGKNNMKDDKGRLPMNIQDNDKKCATMDISLCMTDVQGMRLNCPKTCELYLEDDVYYAKYFPKSERRSLPNQHPTCDSNKDSTCADEETTTATE
jgi:hypothetical protein